MIAAYNSLLLGKSQNFLWICHLATFFSIIYLSKKVAKWQIQRKFWDLPKSKLLYAAIIKL